MNTRTSLSLLLASAVTASAGAQQALYSNSGGAAGNPGLATGVTTASALAAPAASMWSELQTDSTGATNAAGGFSGHQSGVTGAYRFADNFTVGVGNAWTVTRVSVYAYQVGAVDSPFAAANVRIWNGRPGDVGSAVVFGDTTTNRLTAVTQTNVYRVFNTVASPFPPLPDTSRMIWKLDLSVPIVLAPGTYWLDWQIVSSAAGFEAFSPPVTVFGQRAKAGSDARQLAPGGTWVDLLDAGKPLSAPDLAQDLPFIVYGTAPVMPCTSDINGDTFVNGDDADLFAEWFIAGLPLADFDGNGFVNGDDADGFAAAFNAGC